jgi:hypothetical protein
MKKKTTRHQGSRKSYTARKLVLADLENIYTVLQELSGEVALEAGDYKLDSVDELKLLEYSELTKFEITRHSPYITVFLSNETITLIRHEDSAAAVGLFHKIEKILDSSEIIKKRSVVLRTVDTLLFPIGILSFFLGFTIFLKFPHWISALFTILGGLLAWRATYTLVEISADSIPAKVILRNPEKSQGFFQRNSDTLWIELIKALIFSGAGALVTFILSK